MEYIKGPVRYEEMGTYILDAENNFIVDIRGWGRFQYMENGEEKQDEMGQFITDAINEKLEGKIEKLREVLEIIAKGSADDARYRAGQALKEI